MISKSSLKKGGIFLIANLFNASIPFLLLPILTRVLSPEDYGIVAMFTIFLSLANAFVGLSVHGAISIQYFKLDSKELSEYIASCLIILLISAVILFIITVLVGSYFEEIIGVPYKWLLIGIIVSFFQFLITIRLSLWVVTGNALKYGALQISNTLSDALLSLALVILVGLSWEGRLLGQTIAIILFGSFSVYLLYKSSHIKLPKNFRKDSLDALSFGLPLIPHTIGAFVIYSVDRVMISNIISVSAVGIYMVAVQMGKVIELFCVSFNKVYSPWLMKNLSNENLDSIKTVKYSYLAMFFFLIIGIIWAILVKTLLPFIVGKDFQSASNILIFTCMGSAITGLYYIVTNYVFYSKKVSYLAAITFSCGLLNIPLTFYLTKYYGLEGAAAAFLMIQILFFILTWILASKVMPMPWLYFIKKVKL